LIVLSLATTVIAWRTRAVFPALDYLHARDPAQWFSALWMYGSWPLRAVPWLLVVLWLPWIVLSGRVIYRRAASPGEVFLFATGIWLLLQIAALAWGRAGFFPDMSSRYTGLLLWSSIVAVASLAALASAPALRPPWWHPAQLAPFGAAALLGTFLWWR